ncbi:MAG: hypothetical protein GEV28_22145 [Actinophytocola sp.]|nr:hypothetical protein [Actinophytocola sp.]
MLALLGEARELSNPELYRLHGLRLDGKERRYLNDLGLVESRKVGRSFVHELTDRGWRWCADELTAGRPPRAGSLGNALYAVLAGLSRHLERAERGLADLFHPEEAGTLDDRIRAAYDELAKEPGDWISLTALRRDLNGASRTKVDEALRRLNQDPKVNLAPDDDQRSLTQADRDAALRIGGENNHLLSIGPA